MLRNIAAAIDQLGLSDAFDAVYGSSAGALVATYFVAGGGMAQTHRFLIEHESTNPDKSLGTVPSMPFIFPVCFRTRLLAQLIPTFKAP